MDKAFARRGGDPIETLYILVKKEMEKKRFASCVEKQRLRTEEKESKKYLHQKAHLQQM